ncbi:XdhC family protein [Streptomyces sp. NPDC059785]|uniref:XdhC family protein n=1 Tax=Streptomyces sp. NPDC059785 TaxID=3346945 RepID=UPI00366273A1
MRDLLPELGRWYAAGSPFALVTVVGVSRSAPRRPGAAMAVGPGGRALGSVSGGCVEGAAYELAQETLTTGEAGLETFGYSAEDAFAAGLTCGGEVTLLVRRVSPAKDPAFGTLLASVAAGHPVTLATVATGPAPLGATLAVRSRTSGDQRPTGERTAGEPPLVTGTLGSAALDAAVTTDVTAALTADVTANACGGLAQGATALRHYGPHGERPEGASADAVGVFLHSFAPPPRMLVFGAIDYAAAVARIGGFLGYRVTVCDARPVFATPERFPADVEVVVAWPHRYLRDTATDDRTVVCVLTHDPKFDVPLLVEALRRPAAYIGAMGSRRTHDDRTGLLREAGLGGGELARLRSPLGLDLGARTPEEVAVSVAAEIVALRWGGSGTPLTATTGAIHPPHPPDGTAAYAPSP